MDLCEFLHLTSYTIPFLNDINESDLDKKELFSKKRLAYYYDNFYF